jgi:hypothetical protein
LGFVAKDLRDDWSELKTKMEEHLAEEERNFPPLLRERLTEAGFDLITAKMQEEAGSFSSS